MNLNLATYNAWLDEKGGYERLDHLKQAIENTDADIVYLQEVTDRFWDYLEFKTYVYKHYKKFYGKEYHDDLENYGLAILSANILYQKLFSYTKKKNMKTVMLCTAI